MVTNNAVNEPTSPAANTILMGQGVGKRILRFRHLRIRRRIALVTLSMEVRVSAYSNLAIPSLSWIMAILRQ